jgi:CheY-like chemotaxis protein
MATILIVEDDLLTRDLLGKLLQTQGHRPVLASDGLEALDVLDFLRPDLVLLDLMMPRMDGADFLERMRQSQGGQAPVILLSALDNGPILARANAIGVQGHFVKAKTNYDELIERIEALMGGLS